MPIVAITANAMESEVKQCVDRGADDVISKPFTLEALKQMLEKWSPRQEQPLAGAALPIKETDIAQPNAIDISVLKQSLGDNFETQCRLLTSYTDALPEAVDEIQQAFAEKNYQQLADFAHRLKSSSGSLGAMRLAEICQILEIAGREELESDIEASVPLLTQYAEQVIHFVAECSDALIT